MNILSKIILIALSSSCMISLHGNIFLDAAQIQVNKLVNKKPVHKSPIEFKQAVARYIKNTDISCFQNKQRYSDDNVIDNENSAYKKELIYLFKNYGKFSAITLLSRLRSAHHVMTKLDANINGEVYQRYEQICSALLLTCAHVFLNEIRSQILHVLHEIDNLLAYWRYQQQHQVHYFFSKSPTKWIIGKTQEKEIIGNIIKLERKQKALYTLLGSLTEQAHSFTEMGIAYDDCYTWIEGLLEITECLKTASNYEVDGSRFDEMASRLELKLKRVHTFNAECLLSLASAKKPNHFIRNWIMYTMALGSMLYVSHFYVNNTVFVNKSINDKLFSLHESWNGFVVKPSEELWNTIFGKIEQTTIRESVTDLMKEIKDLEVEQGVNKATSNDLKKYLKADRENTQKRMVTLLNGWLSEKKITQDDYDKMISSERVGDITPFQEFVLEMPVYLVGNLIQRDDWISAIVVLAELNIYHYGSSLIQVVFELIVKYGIPVVKEVLIVLEKGNKEWESACKKVNLILNVAVLTPTIILGLVGCNGLHKAYKWAAKRDYSPIRIALADVNSLLIEADSNLDDHDYGKLVYLICKLRHKSTYLKDHLANEFLGDVAKLESKQYSAQTKRGIVENMFNKYAFLGRIAV